MKLSDIVPRDQTLSQHFERSQKKYAESHQLAFYTHPNQHEKLYILDAGVDEAGDSIFVFFGIHQDSHPDRQERLYLIIISWLQKQFKVMKNRDSRKNVIPAFTIIYYNTFCNSSAFSSFKEVIRMLPLQYLDQLKRIIVVEAGLANRFYGWIASGALNNYLYSHTSYIDTSADLPRFGIAANKQFRALVPKQILEEERIKAQGICFQRDALIDDEEPPSKVKIRNPTKQTPYQNRLQDYDTTAGKIPVLLKLLVNHMISNPEMLEAGGIFRKSISIDDQQEVDQHLSHKDYNFITQLKDPYLIASVIVRIFKFLKDPIIPVGTYYKLVNNIQEENMDLKQIKNILSEIPRINQLNLFYLLHFMKTEVVSRHEVNKMTSYNIAAVLMPCLMRSDNPLGDMIHAKKCVKILEFIIIHCEEIAAERGPQRELQQSLKGVSDLRYTTNLSSTYDNASYRNTITETNRKSYI